MIRNVVVIPGMRLVRNGGGLSVNPFLAARLAGAEELIRSELAGEPVLVVPTGAFTGDVGEISEAGFIARELRNALPTELLRLTFALDEKARNTLENLINTRQIVEATIGLCTPVSVHLVSNDWHVRFFAVAPLVFGDSRFRIVSHRIASGDGSKDKASSEYPGVAPMLMAVVQAGNYLRAPELYESIRQRAVA